MNKWNCMSATYTRLLTHRYVLYLTSLRADFGDISVTKHMHRLSSLTYNLWTSTICVSHMAGGYHRSYSQCLVTREYQSGIQSAVSYWMSQGKYTESYILSPKTICLQAALVFQFNPDSKVHGANMGSIWGRQDPGEPHVGPINFVIHVFEFMKNVLVFYLYLEQEFNVMLNIVTILLSS